MVSGCRPPAGGVPPPWPHANLAALAGTGNGAGQGLPDREHVRATPGCCAMHDEVRRLMFAAVTLTRLKRSSKRWRSMLIRVERRPSGHTVLPLPRR
jgi:hypothetical protein